MNLYRLHRRILTQNSNPSESTDVEIWRTRVKYSVRNDCAACGKFSFATHQPWGKFPLELRPPQIRYLPNAIKQ
jgi:hypothetical protein